MNNVSTTLVIVAQIMVASCATSAHEVGEPLAMPTEWKLQPTPSGGGCLPINDIYRNTGVGTWGDEPGLRQARLDAVLGRAMPPVREPGQIEILFDSDSDLLSLRFLGASEPYQFSVAARCIDGWLVWNASLENQYLADGVLVEESHEETRIRTSQERELIVHSTGRATYSTGGVFKDHEATEWWAKFKRVKN